MRDACPSPPLSACPFEWCAVLVVCLFVQVESNARRAGAQCMLSVAKMSAKEVLAAAPHVLEELRRLSQDASPLQSADRLTILEAMLVLSGSLPAHDQWVSLLLLCVCRCAGVGGGERERGGGAP
jgi:hypothetical protein